MGGQEGIDCIYLIEDRDMWQAVVDTITDLCVLYSVRNFLPGMERRTPVS
jgi:hypothetical protein